MSSWDPRALAFLPQQMGRSISVISLQHFLVALARFLPSDLQAKESRRSLYVHLCVNPYGAHIDLSWGLSGSKSHSCCNATKNSKSWSAVRCQAHTLENIPTSSLKIHVKDSFPFLDFYHVAPLEWVCLNQFCYLLVNAAWIIGMDRYLIPIVFSFRL